MNSCAARGGGHRAETENSNATTRSTLVFERTPLSNNHFQGTLLLQWRQQRPRLGRLRRDCMMVGSIAAAQRGPCASVSAACFVRIQSTMSW